MKINDKLYGFSVIKETLIEDIGATLYQAEHIKSGARLLFLDREDENKTFSISFKTIPEDSTGVFHIIEHSVLCGSKKYKAKEPFVELLKGSLNTFLNAMTFPDKTMYPVASRDDKDFLNLTSVYLDAVFHPAILENKNIFLQEGWHYELDSIDGELRRSGVVLSEMKGAFSSADDVAQYHINEMLYPDTCYRFESGGEPEHITKLTYEEFRAGHEKYYHPSNCEIFLDGSVNLEEILPLIDSYLSEYERCELNIDIPTQPPIKPTSRCIEYEIAPEENSTDKTRLVIGYLSSSYDEQEKNVAASILLDAVASSNESPLKKVIIDSGLCEDMNFIPLDSIKQNSILIDFMNVADGKCDELYELFVDTVRSIASSGIDKKMLEASLNSLEFRMREKDFGTMPIGVIYAMSTLEASLYGGDPAQNLSYESSFSSLRKKINEGYFEKLLLSLFDENEHRATLVMIPSSELGEKRAKREAEELEALKRSFSSERLSVIIKECEELKVWQQTPDSKQALKTIPQLEISDISSEVKKIPQIIDDLDGVTVLWQELSTNGIAYADLYFDASDLTKEDIFDLRVLISLSENVRTETRSAIDLQNLIKSELGSFSISASPVTKLKDTGIYVTVSASALESKKHAVTDIIKEILYTSVYDAKDAIRSIIKQMKIASDESFTTGGHLAGFRRAAAYTNVEAAVQEYYSGYEAHVATKNLEKNFDSEFEGLAKRLYSLSKKIFTKERLIISVTGKRDPEFAKALISIIPHGEACAPARNIKPLGIRREGIVIPAQTSYASLAANLSDLNENRCGSLNVVRSLLSYGYLWNEVRVQGGAYGVGLLVRNNGNIGFYSYRDPSPERTLGCYKKAADFLRKFSRSGEDITKFIIGAIGDASPLMTPKLKGTLATTRYLRGISYEDVCKTRLEMLKTDHEELMRIADIIDNICDVNAFCVVAGKDKIDTVTGLDAVLQI